jgi:hypothetical protein
VSFLERMKAAAAELEAAHHVDPWRLRLERVCGKIGFDNMERISSQSLLDILEIPNRQRTPATHRRVARLMTELGWRAVRVRDFNGRGLKEQLRGYVRRGHASEQVT